MIGMASEAIGDMLNEVFAAFELLRRRLDFLRRRRPRLRLSNRQPRHGTSEQRDDGQHNSANDLQKGLHELSRVERFRTFYGTILGMVLSAILLAATLQSRVASVVKIYDQNHAKKLVPLLTEVVSIPTTQF